MMRYTIPMILTSIVLVAGIFAFVPIQQATTVHTTIQASTVQLVDSELTTVNTTDQDIVITCPATSDGCQILEVFIEETSGNLATFDEIDATIDGDAINAFIDILPDDTANGVRIVVTEAGGIALGNGDSISIETADGTTNDAARYTVKVIGFIEGDTNEFGIAFG